MSYPDERNQFLNTLEIELFSPALIEDLKKLCYGYLVDVDPDQLEFGLDHMVERIGQEAARLLLNVSKDKFENLFKDFSENVKQSVESFKEAISFSYEDYLNQAIQEWNAANGTNYRSLDDAQNGSHNGDDAVSILEEVQSNKPGKLSQNTLNGALQIARNALDEE